MIRAKDFDDKELRIFEGLRESSDNNVTCVNDLSLCHIPGSTSKEERLNEAWTGIISTGERIKGVDRINIFIEIKPTSLEINESKYSMYLIQSEFCSLRRNQYHRGILQKFCGFSSRPLQ